MTEQIRPDKVGAQLQRYSQELQTPRQAKPEEAARENAEAVKVETSRQPTEESGADRAKRVDDIAKQVRENKYQTDSVRDAAVLLRDLF